MTTPQAAVEAPGPDTGLDSGNTSLAVSGVPLVVDNNSQEDNDSKASTTSPTAELTDLTAAEFQGLVEDMANTEDTIPDADLAWGDDPTLAPFADTLSSGLSAPNLDTTLPDPVPLVPPGLENFPPDRRATVLSQINKYYVDWLSNDPRVKWLDEMPESQKRLRLQDFLMKKLKCTYTQSIL